eukprot:scaffold1911_cov397-Prasinococcus_capsulatus_cf.AAC.13
MRRQPGGEGGQPVPPLARPLQLSTRGADAMQTVESCPNTSDRNGNGGQSLWATARARSPRRGRDWAPRGRKARSSRPPPRLCAQRRESASIRSKICRNALERPQNRMAVAEPPAVRRGRRLSPVLARRGGRLGLKEYLTRQHGVRNRRQ